MSVPKLIVNMKIILTPKLLTVLVLNLDLQTKKCLRTYTKWADSDHPAYLQNIIRLFASRSYIFCSIQRFDSVSRQWRSWSDCADAHANLGLRCPHLPKGTFPHGAENTREFEMNCLLSSSSISTWGTIKTNTYLYRAIQYLHNGV